MDSFLDRVRSRAATSPMRHAVEDDTRCLTYGELIAVTQGLAAQVGAWALPPEAVIYLLVPDGALFTAAYLAVQCCRLVVAPLIPGRAGAELRHMVARCPVAGLIADDTLQPVVEQVVQGRSVPMPVLRLPAALAAGNMIQTGGGPSRGLPDETRLVAVQYTAGITSLPRGALWSAAVLASLETYWRELLDPRESDVVLGAVPWAGSMGHVLMQEVFLGAGATVRACTAATVEQVRTELAGGRYTVLVGSPRLFEALAAAPEEPAPPPRSLRVSVCGTGPLPPATRERFTARYGGAILETYGTAETGGLIAAQRRLHLSPDGSVGFPVGETAVRIVTPEQREAAVGEWGEILVRGPQVMTGYLGDPTATAQAVQDGWCRTGDLGRRDEGGYLFVADKVADLIAKGGFPVLPSEVEAVLRLHPKVREAAVIGVSDPRCREEVKAYVVLQEGVTAAPDEIITHCLQSLPGYQCPKEVQFTDSLPHSPCGRILYKHLRDRERYSRRPVDGPPTSGRRSSGKNATDPAQRRPL